MRRVDARTARQMIIEKQSVEVGLSLDIQEIFDVEMMPDLREMCQKSIYQVSLMATMNPQFARDYPAKWSFYGCMKGMRQWDADHLIQLTRSWKASDVGDWIRVFGEIIETKQFFVKREESLRTAPQLGNRSFWQKPRMPGALKGQTSGSETLDSNVQATALRRRAEYATLNPQDQGLYDAETTESGFLMKSMMFSGIKKWAIMATDVTGKMDRVFGLMKGATISGTTTDNIYFLNKFSKAVKDPILYLLPVGAIAGGGHHSLLEVALPLTMNGLMDYSIGLYSTLISSSPPPPRPGLRQKGAADLKRVCELWEARPENHLMLCHFAHGQLAGALVADKVKDRAAWQRAFKADETLMNTFASMAVNPSEFPDLINLLRQRQMRWA